MHLWPALTGLSDEREEGKRKKEQKHKDDVSLYRAGNSQKSRKGFKEERCQWFVNEHFDLIFVLVICLNMGNMGTTAVELELDVG